MSQELRVILKCDEHDTEEGVSVHHISIDGVEYEVEACNHERLGLIDPMQKWLDVHGRKQPKSAPRAPAKKQPKKATSAGQQPVATRTGKPPVEADTTKHLCPICGNPYGKYYLNDHCRRTHQMSLQEAQAKTGKQIVSNRGRRPTDSKPRSKRGTTRRKAAA